MKFNPLLLIALSLSVLAGCQEAPSAAELTPPSILELSIHTSSPDAFTGEILSPEARMAQAQANNEALGTFYRIMSETSDWRTAHEQVQRELAFPSDAPQYTREQIAALLMLQTKLLGEQVEAEKLDAIGTYTELLIKHKSPEGPLLVKSIQQLQGHWSEKKIAVAASQAAEGVEAFLTKRCASCMDKTINRISKNTEVALRGNEDTFINQTIAALDDLKHMSEY